MIARRKKKKNVKTVEHQFELANKNKVFWARPQNEITDDKYDEFYKTLTND
jgi:HSP90 family molecular chaperone